MRISDLSADVCSSDLVRPEPDGPSKPKTEDFETPRAGERWRSPCSAARRRRAMKAMIVAAGLATLSALASAAPMQAPGQPPVLTDIRWDILPPPASEGLNRGWNRTSAG